MEIQTARHQHNLEKWRKLVLECRSSGMSVREWCTSQGIRTQTYYRWQREVWEIEVEQAKQQTGLIASGFAQVQLSQALEEQEPTARPAGGQLQIELKGLRLNADAGYPTEKLAQLLRELVGQ